ncbi:hypothetical protein LCGC14_2181440 [marine sediment metagenome]|uniref:M23ase beta-sheet core domain-containing protein n=1 Tax=marine sediment metagenome TaxID=412755 RepID=A0A0F9E9E7_9ZZZZ
MRFVWPLADHFITRGFDFVSDIYVMGDNGVRMHAALDLVRRQGVTAGQEVKAVALGVVVGDAWDKYSGYFIVLEHEGGWRSTYRHLITDAPPVIGQPVMQGQTIGYVGSTGLSSGPHLHIDLWHRQPQDPTAHAKVGWWAHNPELYLGKEDEMTDEEFLARLNKLLTQAEIPATLEDGTTLKSGAHALGFWLNASRIHHEDEAQHAGGSSSEEKMREIAQEEDSKLKVTK